MAHPQVADGGDSLQIWRVAANVQINSCGQLTRGSPPVWGLCKGLTTANHKKSAFYEMLHRASEVADFCEHNTAPSGSKKGGEFHD
jgi:hypothetical protein